MTKIIEKHCGNNLTIVGETWEKKNINANFLMKYKCIDTVLFLMLIIKILKAYMNLYLSQKNK